MKFWGETTFDTKRMSSALKKKTQERSDVKELPKSKPCGRIASLLLVSCLAEFSAMKKESFAVKIYWTQKE